MNDRTIKSHNEYIENIMININVKLVSDSQLLRHERKVFCTLYKYCTTQSGSTIDCLTSTNFPTTRSMTKQLINKRCHVFSIIS